MNQCSSNWELAYLFWPFCSENANFALLTLLPVFITKRNNWLIFQFKQFSLKNLSLSEYQTFFFLQNSM